MKSTTAATTALRLTNARFELATIKNVIQQSYSMRAPSSVVGASAITTNNHTTTQGIGSRPVNTLLLQLPLLGSRRSFHTTPTRHAKKKGNKRNEGAEPAPTLSSNSNSSNGSDSNNKKPKANEEEPLNFEDVQQQLKKFDERNRDRLKQLSRSGGSFHADLIGAIEVETDRKNAPGTTYPLRELARVEPGKGRAVSIMVHEEAHVKPIMSAIQLSSLFNQQPQRVPENDLELVMKVEAQSREDTVREAKAICHRWKEDVRAVRQKRDKLHATWKKEGKLLPDVKRKADFELDKIIKAKTTEIDAEEKAAIKACEGMK